MSALPVEATEPDPSAASLPNDETVNKSGGDSSAPNVQEDAEKLDTESKPANGSATIKEEGVEKNETESSAADSKATNGSTDDKQEHGGKEAGKDRAVKKEEHSPYHKKHFYKPYKPRNYSKYDPSVLEDTNDHKAIKAQVEFYFSDSNLPTDPWLWEKTDGGSNIPVLIKEVCKFGRMKRFKDYEEVVRALHTSNALEVVGEEGEEKVKRKIAYDPTIPRSKNEARSVYVKGFGEEEPSSQFDIEAFFANFGTTNAVRLRRSEEKHFKGSVFVEFADEETAEKFLALDPKPLWKGKQLEIKSKKEYCDGKNQDIKDGKLEPQLSSYSGRGRGRGGSRGGYRGRGGFRDRENDGGRDRRGGNRDPDDWKKRREDDQANGFRDDNKRRNDRGGRTNQRGGRRGGRDGNDRTRDQDDENDVKSEVKDEVPKVEVKTEALEPVENEKKRAREDDDAEIPLPTKKQDIKQEATEAS